MKLYTIQVTGPYAARYRSLLGVNDAEAIEKAKQRHRDAGLPLEDCKFSVVSRLTAISGSVVEGCPATLHPVVLNDGHLAEVEAALRQHINDLQQCVKHAKNRPGLGLRIWSARLAAAQAALDAVVSV